MFGTGFSEQFSFALKGVLFGVFFIFFPLFILSLDSVRVRKEGRRTHLHHCLGFQFLIPDRDDSVLGFRFSHLLSGWAVLIDK